MNRSQGPIPRPEHPRPDARREPWLNLNGEWDFTFDPDNLGEQLRWYRPTSVDDPFSLTITVPFPWESKWSGVASPDYRGAGWYRRSIPIPADWAERGLRPILRFGAVDWNAKVWVNGWFAGEHDGGYSPFEIDLTPYLSRRSPSASIPAASPLEPVIVLRAWDACAADTPLGKQVKEWYTPSSGIWQTVWLEGRGTCHIESVHFMPHLADSSCSVRASVYVDEPGEYETTVSSPTGAFGGVSIVRELVLGSNQVEFDLPVASPRAWSPTDPFLYDATVVLSRRSGPLDRIDTYFGMRDVARGTYEGSDHEFVLLNGEPIYLAGVLDQAFWPDTLHSYPSDDAIRLDFEHAKNAGYNLMRCHIKVNDPRYYYWADRMGMLVMSDMPSTKLYTARSRENWELTFRDALARDFNHPSIIAWILFNETWGLEEHQTEAGWKWVRQMYELCRALDPSRLTEDNSACLYDHVATDLNSWHFYINGYDRARRHITRVVTSTKVGSPFNYVGGEHVQGKEPLLNSEYGGISAGDGDQDVSYCLKYLTSELRRHAKVVGYVYTELADIEWEHNGIVNYDRTLKEWGYGAFAAGMTVADLNSLDFIGADAPPCQTVAPGTRVQIPLFFSHFGRVAHRKVEVAWTAQFCDTLAEESTFAHGTQEIQTQRFGVADAGVIELEAPARPGLVTVAFEARAGSQILNRHYVQLEVHDPKLPESKRVDDAVVLRWHPGDFVESSWSDARVTRKGWKLTAQSYGSVDYEISLPEGLERASVTGFRLLCEAGARTSSRRVDWKNRVGRVNLPQTEVDRKYGADLSVLINGVAVCDVHLPDDPADARGALSHHNETDAGSYGFLVEAEVPAATAQTILERSPSGVLRIQFSIPKTARNTGGLSLYGRRVGRYPIDPTLVVKLNSGH